jgi:sugar phosphate permease
MSSIFLRASGAFLSWTVAVAFFSALGCFFSGRGLLVAVVAGEAGEAGEAFGVRGARATLGDVGEDVGVELGLAQAKSS